MISNQQFHITVSGGSEQANQFLSRMVASALQEKRFTQVQLKTNEDPRPLQTVFDLVRILDPQFFKSSVVISSVPAELKAEGTPFNFCNTEPLQPFPYSHFAF